MRRVRLTLLCLLALASVAWGAEPLSDQTYRDVLEHVLPEKSETAWRDVGWSATLWDAVIRAHEEKKPILLWAMNGHALACT